MTVKELESKLETVSKKVDTNNADLRAEIQSLKELFTKKFENLNAKLELTESTVAVQRSVIDNLKIEISNLRENVDTQSGTLGNQIDRQDQYQRRSNLRISGVALPVDGVSEENEEVLKIVDEVCEDLGVDVKRDDIFRAHRIGPKKSDDDGKRHQAIIVRFRSWKARCALYRARPTKKRPRKSATYASATSAISASSLPYDTPGRGYKSVNLDLSRGSFDLLDKAKQIIATKFPDNQDSAGKDKTFAYSDYNCNLAVRFSDGKVRYFSSDYQLEQIFSDS